MKAPAHLPTLAEQGRIAPPKPSKLARFARVRQRHAADEKGLRQWRTAVRARDQGLCRVCGLKARVSLSFGPTRGECHHIKERAHQPTRHDVRNGIYVCVRDHIRLERHELVIVAGQHFEIDGARYWDATARLTVKDTTTGETWRI